MHSSNKTLNSYAAAHANISTCTLLLPLEILLPFVNPSNPILYMKQGLALIQ